jgi:hypothetical protein
MKKLFTAVPMKKLLLATSIVAMSSTALAAGNSSAKLDDAKTQSFNVIAKYVTPIAVSLDTSKIDFGDVWSDSDIPTVSVIATVTGENNESFTYSVTADSAETLVELTGDVSGEIDFATTVSQALTFNVGLDTSNPTDTDVDENVTISVEYNAIADAKQT